MIYTPDNRAYAGQTALDVVMRMLEASVFTCAKSPEEYMRGVSFRHLHLNGVSLATDTPENFLADLAANAAIEINQGH